MGKSKKAKPSAFIRIGGSILAVGEIVSITKDTALLGDREDQLVIVTTGGKKITEGFGRSMTR